MVTLMSDIMQTISRVRRAMPRNGDVMAICDALEVELVSSRLTKEGKALVEREVKRKLSRAEIQRNYRIRKKAAFT